MNPPAFALFALWSLPAAVPSPLPSQSVPSPLATANAALIRNSGSSNTQPYTVAVRPDGSAVVTIGTGTPQARSLPPPQAAALFEELRAAAPLDALAHGHCMRSASFGTTTTVTFGGVTSPDLSCAPGEGAQALAGTVAAIVHDLHLVLMRVLPRPVPE